MKMMDLLRRPFGRRKPKDSPSTEKADLEDVRIAACALFLEMALADGEFSDAERSRILATLKNDYHLSDEDAEPVTEGDQIENRFAEVHDDGRTDEFPPHQQISAPDGKGACGEMW